MICILHASGISNVESVGSGKRVRIVVTVCLACAYISGWIKKDVDNSGNMQVQDKWYQGLQRFLPLGIKELEKL